MGEHEHPERERVADPDVNRPVPAARPMSDFAIERIGDELIILDADTMQYHALNARAAEIWAACDGQSSAASIARTLQLPAEVVEAIVAQLGEAGLLQASSSGWDSTFSRRRATKLIAAGLIGAAGLPVIKSITAPDSASAASIGQCLGGTPIGAFLCQFCNFACQLLGEAGGACQSITSGPGVGRQCCVCSDGQAVTAGSLLQAQAIISNRSQQGSDYSIDEVEPAVETSDDEPVVAQTPTEAPIQEEAAPAEIPAQEEPPAPTDVPVEDVAPVQQDTDPEVDSAAGSSDQSAETSDNEEEPTEEPKG